MSEVNIILTDKEDGTLGIRILSDAPDGSGADTIAKMFVEYVSCLQEEQKRTDEAVKKHTIFTGE